MIEVILASIFFRESEHGAIDVNILIGAFPPALHPLGQPSVARPTGFPALRFPTGQNRVEPRPERNERPHPPPHCNRPPIWLDQPIEHLQQRRLPSPIMANEPQTFPAAQLERHILDGEELARTETVRGVERRASRALAEQEGSSVEGPESSAEAAAVESPVSRVERLMS